MAYHLDKPMSTNQQEDTELFGGSERPKVRIPGFHEPEVITPTVQNEVGGHAETDVEPYVFNAPLPLSFAGSVRVKLPTPVQAKEPGDAGSSDEPLVKVPRLRARSRQTRELERLAAKLPGWWRDLPGTTPANRSLAWLRSHLADAGAKFHGTVEIVAGEEDDQHVFLGVRVLFSSEAGSRWLWVLPELLAHLYTTRLFRPMSESLLGSLRAKARLWALEKRLPVEDLARVLAGTLSLAMLPVPDEVAALGALRGSAGQWSAEVLGSLARGELRPTTRGGSWWDVLRPSLRFGRGTRGTYTGGGGCPPLRLLT